MHIAYSYSPIKLYHIFFLNITSFNLNITNYKFPFAGEEYLGLFVHFMRGENDDILCWPWEGNITITLLNQQHKNSR